MDESAGRAMARILGLNLTGTLGILLNEVRAGRLTSMRGEIDRLVECAGFFVSHRVRLRFLEAAGEG
jgi:predicted nucleic acid-binding protein